MSQRSIAFAWHIAEISPRTDGVRFRVRCVGDTLYTRQLYFLPRSHGAFRECFELLVTAITRGLVVKVEAKDEPGERWLTVASVSLCGQG